MAIVWLLVGNWIPVHASDSSVVVGDLHRPIKDAVAVLSEFFGKPTIEVYLFAQALSADARRTVAVEGSSVESVLGIAPVGTLMLFFAEGSKQCHGNLLSYTMVFRKSMSFPIQVETDSPINWAYASGNMSDHGLNRVECSLEHGARLLVSVAYHHTLDKAFEAKFFRKPALSKGVDELLFRWNATIDTPIVDQEVAFRQTAKGQNRLRIDTAQVVDSDAIYLREYRALSFRIYGSKVPRQTRGARASADAASQLGHVYVTFDDRGGQRALAYCSIGISEDRAQGGRQEHTVECNGPSHVVDISGRFERDQAVRLQLKGAAPSDAGLKRPPMAWDLAFESVIEGVFDK